jgi:2-amino-4-hydroxy-6-hydroxymethyldihydropteridine diphosphokinase
MVRVAVGFGSNIGDRRAHLDAGLGALSARWKPVSRSSLYESEPVGPVEQGSFLNAVAVFETDDTPAGVLDRLFDVERSRGRTREVRWGPRTLDLDLLLYGDQPVAETGLTVPHPELTNRRFVLEPLLEAWPEAALPDATPLASFVDSVRDQAVARVGPWNVSLWRRLWWRVRSAARGRRLASS